MASDPKFTVEVQSEASIIAGVEACPSGGTVVILPGYYQVSTVKLLTRIVC
jgi:hypothetical protein